MSTYANIDSARSQQLLPASAERRLVASTFVLENDVAAIPAVVDHFEERLARTQFCDEVTRMQVAVALREALANAIYHGNLEVSSELLEGGGVSFDALVQERRGMRPFCDRRVHVRSWETPGEITYVVRDEGPGFNPESLPDPTDIMNLEKPSGRGLLFIRSFMDEVRHNAKGNEITLVLRRHQSDETS